MKSVGASSTGKGLSALIVRVMMQGKPYPGEPDYIKYTEPQQDWNVYQQIAKRSIEAKEAAFFSGFVLGVLVAITFTVIWFAFGW